MMTVVLALILRTRSRPTIPTAFSGSSQTTMQWALTQAEQWRRLADSKQREIIELKKMLKLKDKKEVPVIRKKSKLKL